MGKIAGVNMGGGREAFSAVPSYSIKALGLVLTVVGEALEKGGTRTVARLDIRARKYSRFFLQDGKIIGAVLINSFQDKPAITKLIETGADFSGREKILADSKQPFPTP
ncbi:MAG: oxidoreductase C-terminal domain-containing protein [Patescibacteria group bacterium]